MAQRIKGQEVDLGFTHPEGDQETIGDVVDWEAELDIEILEEAYLGKTANDFDDIFNGVSGTCKVHMPGVDLVTFAERIQRRAQRRDPAGGVFSATVSMRFPSGIRARLTFENIFFGPIPIRAPGRKEYVEASLTWKCSSIRRAI